MKDEATSTSSRNNTPSRAELRAIYAELPLVYSCSGASSAAQLTNTLAVRLDRAQLAAMSCIAGVGGEVRSLVRTRLIRPQDSSSGRLPPPLREA